MGVMLCIDGLPLPCTSKDLRELAEAHGQVSRCWIVHEPGTETSLRFGYIEAATAADAERMIAGLSNQKLNCKPCTVSIEETN
jgi:RNA recognition motif-containing protein